MGWEIIRVWSPDWWNDPAGTTERVNAELKALLDSNRTGESDAAIVVSTTVAEGNASPQALPLANSPSETAIVCEPDAIDQSTGTNFFRRADFAGLEVLPESFYEDSYSPTLRAMVEAVLISEGPVREDILAQRIAKAHGWNRTGAKIRDRIRQHLGSSVATDESGVRFFWSGESSEKSVPFRPPATPDDQRTIAEISLAELTGFILANPEFLNEPDATLVIARGMGVGRLTVSTRQRIEQAMEIASQIFGNVGQSPTD